MREERAARARAARAYAGLRQPAIAEALGVSNVTVKRMESAAKDITIDELHVIADACGVPREFMDAGFASVPAELRAIHARFDALANVLGRTVAQAVSSEAMRIIEGENAGDNNGQEAAAG